MESKTKTCKTDIKNQNRVKSNLENEPTQFWNEITIDCNLWNNLLLGNRNLKQLVTYKTKIQNSLKETNIVQTLNQDLLGMNQQLSKYWAMIILMNNAKSNWPTCCWTVTCNLRNFLEWNRTDEQLCNPKSNNLKKKLIGAWELKKYGTYFKLSEFRNTTLRRTNLRLNSICLVTWVLQT